MALSSVELRLMPSTPADHPHSRLPELLPTGDGHQRCSDCERILYSDPKLAVAGIVPHGDGIVLIKRAIEPSYGKWSFPSGYVNRGEIVQRALEREVLEETELVVRTNRLVGLYSTEGQAVVLAVYEAEVIGGTMTAADEALDAGTFDPNSLPDLAFKHDDKIVREWLESRPTS